MQINLSRIRYKGSYMKLGYDEKKGSDTYIPQFDFYYGVYKETQLYKLQKQQILGASSKTSEILIRHDNRLKVGDLVCLQDKKNYDIIDVNEDPEINGFDIISVQNTAATQQSNSDTDDSHKSNTDGDGIHANPDGTWSDD